MEGGTWPYITREPQHHSNGDSFHRPEIHTLQPTHSDPMLPNYIPPFQGPLQPREGPMPPFSNQHPAFHAEVPLHHGHGPQYSDGILAPRPYQHRELHTIQPTHPDPMLPNYIPPFQGPLQPREGPLPPFSTQHPAFHAEVPLHHGHGPQYSDGILAPRPYQHRNGPLNHPPANEDNSSEETDSEEEEDEEDDLLMLKNLKEALQEVNIHLPRLAATAPLSVLPPKGGGRCRLPNLGNTCYLNAVLQCIYHTPGFPALLAQRCEELEVGQRRERSLALALSFLMTKMDDVKRIKTGVLAYFKGMCGLRDEKFAGIERQEAHDLLAGLLLWLHQDLATQELDCACTKASLPKRLTTTINNKHGEPHSPQQGINSHHNQPEQYAGYKFRPPVNRNSNPSYIVFTGSNNHHNQHRENSRNQQEVSNQNSKSLPREGEKCQRCGVTYRRQSLVSDTFQGILQEDVICPKVGIILDTRYERFTSLSIPLGGSDEVSLEEALQQYFAVTQLMRDCEYCNESHSCCRQKRVLHSPQYLLIHLSRRERRAGRKESVTFPADGLILKEHTKLGRKQRPQQYGLYAVCNYNGTTQQGHYNACCRANRHQAEPGRWYLFDDDEITRTSHFKQPREATILCYTSHGFEPV